MDNTIIQTIQETQQLIRINKTEWEKRYKEYAQLMLQNEDRIVDLRNKFNEFSPLYFYISTTQAKSSNKTLMLDVRYRGQNVALLRSNSNNTSITTNIYGLKKTNEEHFDCTINLDNEDWNSTKAQEFRSFFKNRTDTRNNKNKKNNEHHIESLLLSEFSKNKSSKKNIVYIQPVKYCKIRYAMPTPLKASDPKTLDYVKQYGGGTDILARTGRGSATYVTVIEVKDENKVNEPPLVALNQAIRYAVFIRELLRSDSGENWYKLFGFSSNIPKELKIRVVCAMPDNIEDKTFATKSYPIENDQIECHYIYFKYNGQQLSEFQTSLPQ